MQYSRRLIWSVVVAAFDWGSVWCVHMSTPLFPCALTRYCFGPQALVGVGYHSSASHACSQGVFRLCFALVPDSRLAGPCRTRWRAHSTLVVWSLSWSSPSLSRLYLKPEAVAISGVQVMPLDVSVPFGCLGTAEVKIWSKCAHCHWKFHPRLWAIPHTRSLGHLLWGHANTLTASLS
jgi:hypothetical protein